MCSNGKSNYGVFIVTFFFVFGCYITQVEILHGIYGRKGLKNKCNHSSNANGGGKLEIRE